MNYEIGEMVQDGKYVYAVRTENGFIIVPHEGQFGSVIKMLAHHTTKPDYYRWYTHVFIDCIAVKEATDRINQVVREFEG
jgi:hypothetical protein